MKLLLFSPFIFLLSVFTSNFGINFEKTPLEDTSDVAIAWGDVKAEGGKIVNVKQVDLTNSLEKPITIRLAGKEVKLEGATVNVYPYSGDPVMVYLTGDVFSAANITEIKPKIGWGSKFFLENIKVSIKGKTKSLTETFTLKLI